MGPVAQCLPKHKVIPAKAGTSVSFRISQTEVPAFAGMTLLVGEDVVGGRKVGPDTFVPAWDGQRENSQFENWKDRQAGGKRSRTRNFLPGRDLPLLQEQPEIADFYRLVGELNGKIVPGADRISHYAALVARGWIAH